MTTIKDIARLSGYSIGTVSRVINNRSDVSEKARLKIQQVIEESGFQPNSNAQLLKTATASYITIVVKGMQNVFLEGILEKMQDILTQSGEQTAVMFLDENANEVAVAKQLCREKKPKGLIFLGGNRLNFKEEFDGISVPSVLVTESASDMAYSNLSSYCIDDYDASSFAVKYLVSQGHHCIGIIGGSKDPMVSPIGYRRYVSAKEYFNNQNIAFNEDTQYISCEFSLNAGYEAAQQLIANNKEITAIFALSDTLAIGAMRAISDCGLKIPQDISIIGFDGLDFAKYTLPRLATIQQNSEELAQRSVEDLLLRLNYSRPNRHELVSYKFIVGESVKEHK